MRPDWDEYFLNIAIAASARADCTRAQHGAVTVDKHGRVISLGYNGAPSGQPGCLSAGACPRGQLTAEQIPHNGGGYDDPHSPAYCIAVHAETNAILLSERSRLDGGTIYVTGEPCHGCWKIISATPLARAVWKTKAGETVSRQVH